MIPAVISPDTASPGERDVFRRLRDDPATEEWIVLHSFELPAHKTQTRGEADFVILVPARGILCLEVKAHTHVRYTSRGEWILGSDPPTHRGPFKQAERNMYSVMEILGRRRQEDARSVVVWFAVLFTHTEFDQPGVEWNDWESLDLRDLNRHPMSELVCGVLDKARERVPRKVLEDHPTSRQCRAIAAALRPAFEVVRSPAGRRRQHEEELRAFTEMQYAALDHMRPERNPRVIFEGPAGTGKTLLAIEAARRAEIEDERPLLLCFNRLLGAWLKAQAGMIGAGSSIKTLHGLMRELANVDVPAAAGPDFWERELPEKAIAALVDAQSPVQFGLLIADEAQDLLRAEYLDFLDLILEGGLSSGRWIMFGDFERQALFDAADIPVEEFRAERGHPPAYSLRENCRNTRRIASYVTTLAGLKPGYSSILRPDDGATPRLRWYGSEAERKCRLEEILSGLYGEGYAGEDIVILSPRRQGAAATLLVDGPWNSRLIQFGQVPAEGYIRYGTIQAFKGMEAPVVVVTDIEEVQGERAEALFYTGLTRATDRLIVLADDTVKNDVVAIIEMGEE